MNEKRTLTFTLFLLRLLSGMAGGVAGTLITFIVYFIMNLAIPSEGGALSAVTLIIMTFAGTLIANTITAVMLTFMDSEKYSRRRTTILHVFAFNVILFVLTIPLYLIAATSDIMLPVIALHFLLSAFVSALIMEILAGYGYSLLGVYSVSLGSFLSISFGFLYLAYSENAYFITLGAMPIVWFILMIVGGLVELIYDNFLHYYGVDALNTGTDLGGDEVEELEGEDDDEANEDGDDE